MIDFILRNTRYTMFSKSFWKNANSMQKNQHIAECFYSNDKLVKDIIKYSKIVKNLYSNGSFKYNIETIQTSDKYSGNKFTTKINVKFNSSVVLVIEIDHITNKIDNVEINKHVIKQLPQLLENLLEVILVQYEQKQKSINNFKKDVIDELARSKQKNN